MIKRKDREVNLVENWFATLYRGREIEIKKRIEKDELNLKKRIHMHTHAGHFD